MLFHSCIFLQDMIFIVVTAKNLVGIIWSMDFHPNYAYDLISKIFLLLKLVS